MPEYPSMAEMARLSRVDYSYLESLEDLRPERVKKADGSHGYPAQGAPEWWALRARYEELLRKKLRRERAEQAAGRYELSELQARRAEDAKWCALGNEGARTSYERDGRH